MIKYMVFAEYSDWNTSMLIWARDPDDAMNKMTQYLEDLYNITRDLLKLRIL